MSGICLLLSVLSHLLSHDGPTDAGIVNLIISLSAIVTSGSACKRWLNVSPPDTEKAGKAVERIAADARQTSEIINNVRRLASPAVSERQVCDLNELVEDALSLTEAEMDRQGIQLRRSLERGGLAVNADPVQLQQVMLRTRY